MNIKSQLRAFFGFLAGLGTLFVGWNLIAPDQVEAVNKAGGDLIGPVTIIVGAVGACLARAAMTWAARHLPAWLVNLFKSSGGMSGVGVFLIGTMAVAVGFALPSCHTLSGIVTYQDPETGLQGGVVFKPGEKPRGNVKAPIIDAETGKVVGYVDLASGK